MEGFSKKDVGCPQLLDLMVPKGEELLVKSAVETKHGLSEEKKLELRLGPPSGDWTISKGRNHMCLDQFANNPSIQNPVLKSPWNHQNMASFLHLQSAPQESVTIMKESSQPCSIRAAVDLQSAEKKAFSPANSAQKRTAPAPAPVVGWPPLRSFRKNLVSGCSSKPASESPTDVLTKLSNQKQINNCPKSPFVKVNMDGVPIGRKVDLKAYDSYEKLAIAVDELFRGLLAVQRDTCVGGIKNEENEGKGGIGGLLDGSGEYTLVYEDNEGDRMLVGDVPWHMFVSTVKRLRVLKSSELPTLSILCRWKK
ncbi:auxin-responsive protein IAA26-like isoform X2 [Primulina huaijiensis]|uniref:auxin-responsive protein IAA26-like isoform X2 n=1 Tax=Primulina huaijiensis TaxID=1492673 RepID=UPI003CC71F03